MTPLPAPLADGPLTAWRLDALRHAATWDSGEGAYLFPGRWHRRGFRMVYASFDPATTILEAAVHKGFDTLDRVPHVLTAFEVLDPGDVHVVPPDAVPNPRWLASAQAGAGQRRWGEALMRDHPFVALPSTVSQFSWNLIFSTGSAAGRYRVIRQERLSLDTRLNPDDPIDRSAPRP